MAHNTVVVDWAEMSLEPEKLSLSLLHSFSAQPELISASTTIVPVDPSVSDQKSASSTYVHRPMHKHTHVCAAARVRVMVQKVLLVLRLPLQLLLSLHCTVRKNYIQHVLLKSLYSFPVNIWIEY